MIHHWLLSLESWGYLLPLNKKSCQKSFMLKQQLRLRYPFLGWWSPNSIYIYIYDYVLWEGTHPDQGSRANMNKLQTQKYIWVSSSVVWLQLMTHDIFAQANLTPTIFFELARKRSQLESLSKTCLPPYFRCYLVFTGVAEFPENISNGFLVDVCSSNIPRMRSHHSHAGPE